MLRVQAARVARWVLTPILGLLLVLGSPSPVEAQAVLRIIPQVGLYAPMADLGEVRNGIGTLVEGGRRSSTLAFGLGVEAAPLPTRTSVRAQVLYATEASLPVGGLACPECAARSSVLSGTLTAVVRPVPTLLVVRPYFLIGGGVIRYGFDPRIVEGEAWRTVLRDQARPALQVGAGFETRLWGVLTQWELSGLLSTFRTGEEENGIELGVRGDRWTQSDLLLTVGVPLGGR